MCTTQPSHIDILTVLQWRGKAMMKGDYILCTVCVNVQVEADYTMREELVLKIAILAEKFAPSVQW